MMAGHFVMLAALLRAALDLEARAQLWLFAVILNSRPPKVASLWRARSTFSASTHGVKRRADLALAACRQKRRVRFTNAAGLVHQLLPRHLSNWSPIRRWSRFRPVYHHSQRPE